MNKAAMNMAVQISPLDTEFISFQCMPQNGIPGSYDKSIFNFLKDFHTLFHNVYKARHGKTNIVLSNLYVESKRVELTEAETGMVTAKSCGGGEMRRFRSKCI